MHMHRYLTVVVIIMLAAGGCVSLDDAVTTPPETNVTYETSDGTVINAYLALPEGEGPFPAVLMIHEWWGLNQDVVIMARALAEHGFAVLAADSFRGELATSVPQAISLNRSTPDEQIYGDLDAALAFLRSRDAVDADRVATMGFCFGGRQAMHLGIRSEGLAAVVTLYGSGLVTEPDEMGNLAANGPVLGIFGEDDNSIPLREIRAFEAGLGEIGARHTITVYEDVGHAFVKSSTYDDEGAAGEAWEQLVGFLTDHLDP